MNSNELTKQLAMRLVSLVVFALLLECSSPRRFYVYSELSKVNGDDFYAVVPGPWDNANVPIVYSDANDVPDDLVIPTLKALMALPGATVACDPKTNRPPPHATEYCLALYKTPQNWRASWPVRSMVEEVSLCKPPYGGVEDEEFGREISVVGFAHNHPCGKHMSSPDLGIFPIATKNAGADVWELVIYAETPSGELARSPTGGLIPTWAWLATHVRGAPRFYKWNPKGNVFAWSEGKMAWEFKSKCEPQSSAFDPDKALEPKCSPEID